MNLAAASLDGHAFSTMAQPACTANALALPPGLFASGRMIITDKYRIKDAQQKYDLHSHARAADSV
jgi:hypothetical protein